MEYAKLSRNELESIKAELEKEYNELKAKGLKLDMSRGKPSKAQLDLSTDLFNMQLSPEEFMIDGIDARNYGTLSGLPSMRRLFADLLGVKYEETFIGGSASLNLMFDLISKAYTHGLLMSEKPWSQLEKVKFLCPAPGYDRHFAISKSFGMEMIYVPINDDGPDMDMVEELVKDPAVKGMWCVPKYSNPCGIIYSDEVIDRIAALKPAAKDFALMWDNAYCVHEFDGEFIPFRDMLTLCRENGNENMVYEFASTSKITFPGAGVSVMATSEKNMEYLLKILTVQTISYDKLNQLKHFKFFKDKQGVLDHMKKHALLMKPKFDVVIEYLDKYVKPYGVAKYNHPKGGYFVSLDTMEGCAKRTHQLVKEAGVVMTGAGATFPYGNDPKDSNLRIAPSLPPIEELKAAMEVLCVSVKLAAVEKLLG